MPAPTKVKEGQCEGCYIFIGGKEEPWWELTEYRDHKLCSWCINSWMRREELAGREITFEEFTTGKVKKDA
ncbi:MAG TPA: hypothetical protein VMW45_03740 [Dehalococcoidia bacterium]|nr:hypothetical protein [Dehalococcoidia bacterium]